MNGKIYRFSCFDLFWFPYVISEVCCIWFRWVKEPFFHWMLSYLHHIRFIWHNLLTSTYSINTLECVIPQITVCAVLFVVCVGICRTAQTLMNECFDLTAMYEASDGWACFGLITGFTRGLRIAVNQGPHYKSCRLSRARSHPRLMSQRSRLFAVF